MKWSVGRLPPATQMTEPTTQQPDQAGIQANVSITPVTGIPTESQLKAQLNTVGTKYLQSFAKPKEKADLWWQRQCGELLLKQSNTILLSQTCSLRKKKITQSNRKIER